MLSEEPQMELTHWFRQCDLCKWRVQVQDSIWLDEHMGHGGAPEIVAQVDELLDEELATHMANRHV